MDQEKSSVTDKDLESRKLRFNYILHFWKCREISHMGFWDFFTKTATADSNSNKEQPADRDPPTGRLDPPPPTHSPPRHTHTHSTPSSPRHHLLLNPHLHPLFPSSSSSSSSTTTSSKRSRLEKEWEGRHSTLESASTDFYPCLSDGDGDGDGAATAARGGGIAAAVRQRWPRGLFLLLALACLGYVAVSAAIMYRSHSVGPPSSSASSSSCSSGSCPGQRPGPGLRPGQGQGHPADRQGHEDGCDWDCLHFLFN